MSVLAKIVEIDQERDRKTCLSLDLKVTGANRELAQWCFDHPRYSQRTIGQWLGCDHTRIYYLRKWASSGFEGSPFDRHNKPDSRGNHDGAARHQAPLETNDNSESDDDFDPETGEIKSNDPRLYTADDVDEEEGVTIDMVEGANAAIRRRVFMKCADYAIRRAEQGAGLRDARGSEIDKEIIQTCNRVLRVWADLRAELKRRR